MIPPFACHDVTSVEEACAVLAAGDGDARVLAGGLSLLILLKQELIAPRLLVNVKGVPGLSDLDGDAAAGLRIGAAVTHAALAAWSVAGAAYPWITEAAGVVGSTQVRNRATIGGILAHGEPAADLPPALIAADAEVTIAGPGRRRRVPVETLFHDYYETILAPDEILVEVTVPPRPGGRVGGAYLKFGRKKAVDYALVGVAAAVAVAADGQCTHARLALAGAAPTPLRVRSAEAILCGTSLPDAALNEAVHVVERAVDPPDDIHASADYRRAMAGVFTRRALREARARALTQTGAP